MSTTSFFSFSRFLPLSCHSSKAFFLRVPLLTNARRECGPHSLLLFPRECLDKFRDASRAALFSLTMMMMMMLKVMMRRRDSRILRAAFEKAGFVSYRQTPNEPRATATTNNGDTSVDRGRSIMSTGSMCQYRPFALLNQWEREPRPLDIRPRPPTHSNSPRSETR